LKTEVPEVNNKLKNIDKSKYKRSLELSRVLRVSRELFVVIILRRKFNYIPYIMKPECSKIISLKEQKQFHRLTEYYLPYTRYLKLQGTGNAKNISN